MNQIDKTTLDNHTPIRTSADLTAYVVHSLGYWPHDSIVFIAATPGGIGPCLRADTIACKTPRERQGFIEELLDMMPETDRDGTPFSSLFCLILGATHLPEAQRLHGGGRWVPEMSLIRQDALAVASAQEWIKPLYQASKQRSFQLKCALYISTYTRWHLNDPAEDFAFEGFIDDVVISNHYTEMIASGSNPACTVDDQAGRAHWNITGTQNPQAFKEWEADAAFWAQSYRAMTSNSESYCRNYTAQKMGEFKLWEDAIETVITICGPCNNEPSKQGWADRIRASLPAEVTGFLAATLTTRGTAQLVLGLACTSRVTVEQALGELDVLSTSSPDPSEAFSLLLPRETIETNKPVSSHAEERYQLPDTDSALDFIASYLMGTSKTAPCWMRLEALEIILDLLQRISTPDVSSRLQALHGWIHWLRGASSQAHSLLQRSQESAEHREFIAYEEAIRANCLPRWCTISSQTWRGREFDLPN